MLSFFPRGVLDEILNLIESVSEGFLSYSYLCIFTCLAARAVHLEIAFGLDTNSFLNVLYRMTDRRGLMKEMYSDNGTNFRAADKELKSLISQENQRINH